MIKSEIKKFFLYIISIIILTIIEALILLSLPDFMANIINYGIGENNLSYIYTTGLKMILITLFSSICAISLSFCCAKLGANVASDLRMMAFTKITLMDEEAFNNFTKASLLTRTTNDINQISMVISNFFRHILFAITMGSGGIIKAFSKSKSLPALSIILIMGILLVIIFLIIVFLLVIRKFEILQNILDKINSKTKEILSGTLVIRAFNKEETEEKEFKKTNTEYNNLEYFLNKIMALLNPYMSFIMNSVVIVIMLTVSKTAVSTFDIGNMLSFSQYSTQVITAFLTLSIIFVFLPKAKVSYNRIKEVIDTKNTLEISTNPVNYDGLKEDIQFQNVSFRYNGSEEDALKNITCTFKKGETYGIIGSTASGKTTLVNLLCHLYDCTSGNILIDGVDNREISLNDLLKDISYIPKESSLFKGTIKENLKDGKKNATDKEIKDALENASALFITDLNTNISENAINFSGGEKQRLSIARGLIKKASILIIDDALSALDYKTDLIVRKNIKKNKDQTKLIISSRIATIMNADKILVLDDGKLIGFDNHENLLKNCKTYQEIVISQLGNEALK